MSTVNLDCDLELAKTTMLATQRTNPSDSPLSSSGFDYRRGENNRSEKMVCTRAKTKDDSKVAAWKYARILHKLRFNATFKNFKIQNMVGDADLEFPLQLERLQVAHATFLKYDPEVFLGLIYKTNKPTVLILLLVSGKMVITGAKLNKERIYTAFDNIKHGHLFTKKQPAT